MVPVLDNDRRFRGYILTLEDITQRAGVDARRTTLLQTLTEGQRSAIASVRAAVETILAFPDMDEDGRQQFLGAIRDEAVKMSGRLDALEVEYAEELKAHVPFQEMLGSELVAAIGRSVRETGGVDLEVDAPLDPIWLRVDTLAIERSILFLVSQLSQACSASALSLTLEQRGGLVGLALSWSGAPLHGEALKRWGLRNVMTDRHGTSLNLFEVIERHGGAIWAHPPAIDGRPFVRVVLPVSEGRQGADRDAAEAGYGHDFDFRLFEETTQVVDRMNAPLSKLSYTVIDTETTGLDPRGGDEIIAIGAVRIVNGRLLRREIFDSWSSRRSRSPKRRAPSTIFQTRWCVACRRSARPCRPCIASLRIPSSSATTSTSTCVSLRWRPTKPASASTTTRLIRCSLSTPSMRTRRTSRSRLSRGGWASR